MAGRPPRGATLGERHNEAMTSTPAVPRDPNQTLAYRIATMLIGVGTVHFLAPKPFDEIVPAELPGSPRFYTYASGVAEVGIGGLLLARGTRRFGALAAVALFLEYSRQTSTCAGCGGTSPGRCVSLPWPGCPCRFR